jgi:hypothetical protein
MTSPTNNLKKLYSESLPTPKYLKSIRDESFFARRAQHVTSNGGGDDDDG